MYRLLDTAVSYEGSQRLRAWLTAPVPSPDQIVQRQQLVRELAPLSLFRDKLIMNATIAAGTRKTWEANQLLSWLERHAPETSLRQVETYGLVASVLLWVQGRDPEENRKFFERALRLHRERGDRRGEAWALDYIGLSFRYVGDYGRARRFLEQGLGIFGEIGDWGSERHARFHLAWLYIIQGG